MQKYTKYLASFQAILKAALQRKNGCGYFW